MIIAVVYGCSLGAIAALPGDYVWRRCSRTMGPLPRMTLAAAILGAIALGGRLHIYHGDWPFSGVIVGLLIGSLIVHASAARWWSPMDPDQSE